MPSRPHYKTLHLGVLPYAFHISVAERTLKPEWGSWQGGGCWGGGLHHSHMAGDASPPTHFQFRLVFINNLHFPEAYIFEDTCHITTDRFRNGEGKRRRRRPSFDKWMSGDETKISRSMKGARGREQSINPTPGW